MGADQNSRKRKFGLDPKYAPNPRVLGEVQSSYRGATLTQNNPSNKSEQAWKQARENNTRTSKVYITG